LRCWLEAQKRERMMLVACRLGGLSALEAHYAGWLGILQARRVTPHHPTPTTESRQTRPFYGPDEG
jgi:hypothetical protein